MDSHSTEQQHVCVCVCVTTLSLHKEQFPSIVTEKVNEFHKEEMTNKGT